MMLLEERLARLEALQAINELKGRYTRLADAKYTPSQRRVASDEWEKIAALQAACFTEDAEWEGGGSFGGTLRGRAALAEWFTRSPWRFAVHYYVAPELTLAADDRAEGRWKLWQLAVPHDGDDPILLAATTRETYRKTETGWLIERMRFEQIHTVDLSRAPAELRSVLPEGSR